MLDSVVSLWSTYFFSVLATPLISACLLLSVCMSLTYIILCLNSNLFRQKLPQVKMPRIGQYKGSMLWWYWTTQVTQVPACLAALSCPTLLYSTCPVPPSSLVLVSKIFILWTLVFKIFYMLKALSYLSFVVWKESEYKTPVEGCFYQIVPVDLSINML